MTKTKTTKRALLSAILALVMTVSMLVGTTFAWFTDSVTSSGNKIVAGNLDVELHLYDGSKYVDISDATQPIFGADGLAAAADGSSTLWEPGKTQVAYLAIKNDGSLALKYKVALTVTSITKNLNDVVTYTITPDAKGDAPLTAWDGTNAKKVVAGEQLVSGTDVDAYVEMQPGDVHYFALSVHMDELAGNDYMDGEISFDLTVLATQLDSESDSFGDDYDGGLDDYVFGTEPGTIKENADGSKVFYSDTTDRVRLMALPENVGSTYAVPLEVNDLGRAIVGNKTIETLIIHPGVTAASKSLENNTTVKEVVFEEGTTTLPNRLFYRSAVESVVIPEGVTTVENHAFYASNVKTVVFPESVTSVGTNLFDSSAGIETVIFKGDVEIQHYMFRACASLKTVIFEGENTTCAPGSGMAFSNKQNGDASNITIYATSQATVDSIKANTNSITDISYEVVDVVSDGFYMDVDADVYGRNRTYFVASGEAMAAFAAWRESVPAYEYSPYSAFGTLLCDIDMTGVDYTPFNCNLTVFDGNGFTISNLNAGQGASGKSGLVSYLGGGLIKNLTLENATVSGCQAGLFAGQCEGGKIENCFIAGKDNKVIWSQNTTSSYVEQYSGIGAVVGWSNGGSFEVTSLDGAVVALDENGMTTLGTKVDSFIGGGAANGNASGFVNDGAVCGAKFEAEVDTPDELEGALTDDSKEIVINVTSDISLDIGTGTILGGKGTEKIIIKGATGNETVTFTSTYRSYLNSDATLYLENVKVTHLSNGSHWHDYCLLLNCDVVAKDVEFLMPVAVNSKKADFDNVTFNFDQSKVLYSMFIVAGSDVSIANSSITSQRGIKIADEDAADKNAVVNLTVSNTTFNTTKKSAILVGSAGGANITVDNVDIASVAADSTNAVWVDADYPHTYDAVVVVGATKAQEE